MNMICLALLIRRRQRYQCFPYLCGLIVGNLCFLLFLGLHNILANVEWLHPLLTADRIICQIGMYFMAVCRHIHHLFIAATCIERYFSLFPIKGYVSSNTSHRVTMCRQTLTVITILLFCFVANLWLIPATSYHYLPLFKVAGCVVKGMTEEALLLLEVCKCIESSFFIKYSIDSQQSLLLYFIFTVLSYSARNNLRRVCRRCKIITRVYARRLSALYLTHGIRIH